MKKSKQIYEEYRWNKGQTERGGRDHINHLLAYDLRRIIKGDGRG